LTKEELITLAEDMTLGPVTK